MRGATCSTGGISNDTFFWDLPEPPSRVKKKKYSQRSKNPMDNPDDRRREKRMSNPSSVKVVAQTHSTGGAIMG